MMGDALVAPEAGQIVHVRQRLYLVEQVVAPAEQARRHSFGCPALMTMHKGNLWSVLWEHELDAEDSEW